MSKVTDLTGRMLGVNAHIKTQLSKPAHSRAKYTDAAVVAGAWSQCRQGGGGVGSGLNCYYRQARADGSGRS